MSKKEESKKAKKNGFSKGIGSLLNGSFLTRQLVQNNMPFIFFLVFIMICYISYGYFAEQNAKAKNETVVVGVPSSSFVATSNGKKTKDHEERSRTSKYGLQNLPH